jgi:hypothetical protein
MGGGGVLVYIATFAAGASVGLAELLSRHRDYPLRAATSGPSLAYMVLNGLLSVMALLVCELWRPTWLLEAAPSSANPTPPRSTP